jgi:hypothetical protein
MVEQIHGTTSNTVLVNCTNFQMCHSRSLRRRSLSKHCIEHKITSDRIFNVDETVFCHNNTTKNVVAMHGSKNVWSNRADSLFHLIVNAYVGANEFAVPPHFVVPGQCLSRDMMDGCGIPGGSVTVVPKGFMNARLLDKWLGHFHSAVPETTKRPLILVYDGYSSHINEDMLPKQLTSTSYWFYLPYATFGYAVFKQWKTIMIEFLVKE